MVGQDNSFQTRLVPKEGMSVRVKNEKGITLTSVIIYIIGMVIVLATIANLTSFFYKNINIEDANYDSTTQYTKFSSLFLDETNNENNYIIDCKTTNENNIKLSYIIFSSGNQYTYTNQNNCIYKNNIKICENVEDCDFSYTFADSKYQIKVKFKTNIIDNETTYTL